MPLQEIRIVAYIFALFLITGCEAPLDLKSVERVSAEPIKRFDQFQSAAREGEKVVVVGSGGAVLVSTDGAKQWLRHDLPGAPVLMEVAACPDATFAVLDAARKIWLSADGGKSWSAKAIETEESVTTLACDPEGRLWVGGSFTTLLSSADGGDSWESLSFDEDAIFTDIQFVDSRFGVAVGEFGTVVTTEDGGETWEPGPGLPNDFYPQAALFLDRENGYVVGLSGKILKTDDGGASWEYEATPTEAPLYGLARQRDALYAVGEGGEMLRSEGGRWERVRHGKPVRSYLRSALPVNEKELLIAGGAGAVFLVSNQK